MPSVLLRRLLLRWLANRLLSSDLGTILTPKIAGDWTVDKVIATIPTGKPVEGSLSPVPYFHLLERLKTTKREGWRRFGITRYGNPHGLALPGAEQGKKKKKEKRLTEGATRGRRGESIADHMYRMAMMTMLAPPSLVARIDRDRCIKMCLVHDMAESLVGDITPVDGVPRTEKHAREAATMDFLAKRLLPNVDGGAAGREIQEVWDEYEKSETLESKFVHDIDKMELLFQMVEYEKRAEGRRRPGRVRLRSHQHRAARDQGLGRRAPQGARSLLGQPRPPARRRGCRRRHPRGPRRHASRVLQRGAGGQAMTGGRFAGLTAHTHVASEAGFCGTRRTSGRTLSRAVETTIELSAGQSWGELIERAPRRFVSVDIRLGHPSLLARPWCLLRLCARHGNGCADERPPSFHGDVHPTRSALSSQRAPAIPAEGGSCPALFATTPLRT